MLSNTAETKPRPIATRHDASGSFSTGIIDAAVTSESRKIVPLNVSGSTSQSGRRTGTVTKIDTQTASPMNGKRPATSGYTTFMTTLVTTAATRISATIPTRITSTRTCDC